jgi:hypothetical protein
MTTKENYGPSWNLVADTPREFDGLSAPRGAAFFLGVDMNAHIQVWRDEHDGAWVVFLSLGGLHGLAGLDDISIHRTHGQALCKAYRLGELLRVPVLEGGREV